MPDFRVTLQVNRLGVGVANPQAVLGHFGEFNGNSSGEIVMGVRDWGSGMTVLMPVYIVDPSDGWACIVTPVLTDGGSITIEMSTQGKYVEPGVYAPPAP